MLQIEKMNPPEFDPTKHRNRKALVPWGAMMPGDSVLLDREFLAPRGRGWAYKQVFEANGRHNDKRFIARKTGDTFRIFCVELHDG